MKRFAGLKDKAIELVIGGEKIKIMPKVKDAEMFILLKREMTAADAARITEIIVNAIQRANPEDDIEDIKAFVARNYGVLLKELSIAYGFATRKDFEELKAMGKKI